MLHSLTDRLPYVPQPVDIQVIIHITNQSDSSTPSIKIQLVVILSKQLIHKNRLLYPSNYANSLSSLCINSSWRDTRRCLFIPGSLLKDLKGYQASGHRVTCQTSKLRWTRSRVVTKVSPPIRLIPRCTWSRLEGTRKISLNKDPRGGANDERATVLGQTFHPRFWRSWQPSLRLIT